MTQKRTNSTYSTTNYNELSIQVSLSGLSFCVLDGLSKTIFAIEQHPFENSVTPQALLQKTEQLFSEKEILEQSFKKVYVIHRNNLSTIVPRPLFSDKNLSEYLKFNVKIFDTDFVTYDDLGSTELINVYIPFVNINNYIFDRFGEFEYRHFSSVLVETLLRNLPDATGPMMYVHVQKGHFEIVVIKDKKLALYNTFEYTNKEDFIYYILFTAEQLQLNPEEFPLYLLGDVHDGDELHQMVYTYVRHVDFGNNHCHYQLARDLEAVEPHREFISVNSF
ncbi:DUF3822 family protein [Sinomicrobium weinanense]|uniref:DUF3822 family protein n=1 Tax=Sinomicrobium weinanense TaxID=2842200 RepID=A0A926Q4B7_9FLAO|nr:DUF3822 family protein [Sinomicrobium weinanense]MBC9796705.1 DUF3822 family protein [Sinomicrobium weinanense]MBU3123020.1 DUF3822 family protein [Sinomicrobium weinanense]